MSSLSLLLTLVICLARLQVNNTVWHCFVSPEWWGKGRESSVMCHTLCMMNMSCYHQDAGTGYRLCGLPVPRDPFISSSVALLNKSRWYEVCVTCILLYLKVLNVQSAIQIQRTFCQIQQVSPRGPLAVRSVCALKTHLVFVHSPGSVNGKQTETVWTVWPRDHLWVSKSMNIHCISSRLN